MKKPKSEDYLWGRTYKAAQMEYMDFAEKEIERLTDKNERLFTDLKGTLIDFMNFQSQHHIEQFDDFNETVNEYLEKEMLN